MCFIIYFAENLKMDLPSGSPLVKHWALDKEIVFLNHGSFGACPVPVLQKQDEYRRQMESGPVRFMLREAEELLWKSKESLAAFVGARPQDIAYVTNATVGVNTVLNSLQFNAGDELITTNQGYGACNNAMKWFAEKAKARMIVAEIPFPVSSPEEVTQAILKTVTPRTRLVMIDHITSPTGIIFPVKEIVAALKEKGIDTLIDGAHAPGMVDLNIDEIGAAYYTGNCHKWICSPKGSAFLHVRIDKQHLIRPMVISHLYDRKAGDRLWSSHFFWSGTGDFTPYLCVKDAIEFMATLFPGGWQELREHNRSLTLKARKYLSEKTGVALPAPESMIGALSAIQIGKGEIPPYTFNYINPVQERLWEEYKIEVPVFGWNNENPRLWLRFSVQAYNSMEQYEYLTEAVLKIR